MIKDFKDEPYVLMWMLGNENDTAGCYENSTCNNTNAVTNPEAYASFVGEACRMIKIMDQDHPVAVCNGSLKIIPYYKKFAQEIDIIGMNQYSGPFGFGVLWNKIKEYFDRPVLITEYGCDAYNLKTREEDEDFQALYHKRAWQDIEKNSFGGSGAGNSLGGVVFCWLDKWWLCGLPTVHDTDIGAWEGQTNDGSFQDEWMGVCGQGDGTGSPFVRQPRKVYYLYKNELWAK
jgi:beta-glucuronidase